MFAVIGVQRHAPCGVLLRFTGGLQLLREFFVIGEQTCVVVTQCDHARTGECCHINHGGGFVAFGIGEGVAQNQATFGVGIQNFNGQTGHGGDDVARLVGIARRHVFAGGDQADHIDIGFELAQYFECA